LYRKYNLIDKIRSNSLYLHKRLEGIENSFSIAKQTRCKGLLGAIDLVSRTSRSAQPIEVLKDKRTINSFILNESLKLGVFLRTLGNTILIIPPLAINRFDLGFLLDIIDELIRRVERLL
jgi:adenosylmethionine---8-amino-7-oxononanoate aminotransferase